MRILITGHKGYIGSVLTPHLLHSLPAEIVGLDCDWFADPPLSDCVENLQLDVRDVAVRDLMGFDAIVHLAAISNDPMGELDTGLTYDINYLATLRLAEKAKQAGVSRFLFFSSCSAYGSVAEGYRAKEHTHLVPQSAYAFAKVRAEQSLSQLADEQFSPILMRNATVYGHSPRIRTDLVVNNLVASAVTSGKIQLLSDGEAWRPLIHVQDLAGACAQLLAAPREKIHNQTFNVGSSVENYRIRDVAFAVKAALPECEITVGDAATHDSRNYCVDFTKLEAAFPDLRVQWTVRNSVADLVQLYQRLELTAAEFTAGRFARLTQLQQHIAAGRLDSTLRWT